MRDITTDDDLVEVLNELKHCLKAGLCDSAVYSPMRADFNDVLNDFIARWKLDVDPHIFAEVPVIAACSKRP